MRSGASLKPMPQALVRAQRAPRRARTAVAKPARPISAPNRTARYHSFRASCRWRAARARWPLAAPRARRRRRTRPRRRRCGRAWGYGGMRTVASSAAAVHRWAAGGALLGNFAALAAAAKRQAAGAEWTGITSRAALLQMRPNPMHVPSPSPWRRAPTPPPQALSQRGVKQAAITQPEEGDPLADKYGDPPMCQSTERTGRTWTRVEELTPALEGKTVRGRQGGGRALARGALAWVAGVVFALARALHCRLVISSAHLACLPTACLLPFSSGAGARAHPHDPRQGQVGLPRAAPAHRHRAGGWASAGWGLAAAAHAVATP